MKNVFINEESGKLRGLTPRILKRFLLTVASIFFLGILVTQLVTQLAMDWFIGLWMGIALVVLYVSLGRIKSISSNNSENDTLPANLNAKKLNELKKSPLELKDKKMTGTWAGRRR